MSSIYKSNNKEFLSIQSEMNVLTREKDWSQSSLGPMNNWEQSLKTIVGIILGSKFPMFLFWGPELICFYNDAYRPSLGIKGKHPNILGMRGEEAWVEIWEIIKPLIDQVMNGGEATWSENQLIPIFRNGKIEDVYWTFSYSPVNDDSGNIGGVLVTCSETTGQIITKLKLEESERRLRSMILQAPIAIAIFRGRNYVTEIANSRALELWGRSEEEVLNKPILEAMPELISQGIEKLLDDVYDSGNTFSTSELPVEILRNGKLETVYINFCYEAIHNSNGDIDGVMGVGYDITHQVAARKRIEESDKFNRTVLESSPDCFKILDLNGRIEFMNFNGLCQMEIDDFSEYKNQFWWNLWGTDNELIVQEALRKALEGHTAQFIAYCPTAKGTPKWWDVVVSPVGKIGESIQQIISVSRDITFQKSADIKIIESEKKFRLLADSMPQQIWTADLQGNLDYYNQSVFDFSGLSIEQIQETGWIQIVHPHDRDGNIAAWKTAIDSGTDFLFEHRFRRHDGEYRWQLSRAIPQRDENGIIKMWVGTSTDIQDQKTFAEALEKEVHDRTKELAQNNIELEKVNKELQSFAYISSHDLQEPLRKIQTFATRIADKEKDNLSEKGKELFLRMQSAAERMQSLIDDLLAYSRTQLTDRHYEKINIKDVIDNVIQDLSEEIQLNHAVVENSCNCEMKIIPFQFYQLFYNLIFNALKFSKNDEPLQLVIKCEYVNSKSTKFEKLEADKKYCHISLVDNGIGFEMQYKERIFELFQRLHGKEEYKGTGIGLAIVKKIVENHHGFIIAKGELGVGARFDMYFPVE